MTPLLTVDEVAAHLRCSRASVWRRVGSGELPSLLVAGHRMVRADDLEAYTRRLRDENQAQFERSVHASRTMKRTQRSVAG